jgi:tRNA(Arg) A34 adenosine deaminase TadA
VKLAETSEENMKHGCVIVLGGSVQAVGVNKRTNDPYTHKQLHWLSEHAEMAALRRCKRTKGAVLYVARVNKRGEERMSKPCPKCAKLLKDAGIKKVVYTIDSSLYL